ncbi:MAG: ATP-binding protein [Hyphomicrobium sp.]
MPRESLSARDGREIPQRQFPEPFAIVIALAALLAAMLILTELDVISARAALVAAAFAAAAAGLLAVAAVNPLRAIANRGEAIASPLNPDTNMTPASLVAAIPDPALLLDASATIVHYNHAAEQLFGKALAGLALEHVSRDPELLQAVESAKIQGERTIARFEQFSGVERQLMATISPIGPQHGIVEAMALITFRDLSDQYRMLEMRSDFIANASHELRTPLASVRGFIETLQGPARNDEAARTRFLAIMAAQAERMTRLIDDLLLLSRVEEKANLAPTGSVDIGEVLTDVVRTLLPIADDRGISIALPRPGRPATVPGERDELFQVFQNLIENAVKYGRDGGSVKIELATSATTPGQQPKIIVSVEDDGPGIAPEHLPRLTERFYRVNADQSRKIGGTGLGLAIVKHVLNRHRGELQIASEVGTGTTARVILPSSRHF